MDNEEFKKRPNRKRKKTFLKNAKKYGKKGHFGRGAEMDQDTYQFFLRSLEAYNAGFDDAESKSSFITNVFENTIDEELNYSCNQVGCRVIETLLPFADDSILKRFIDKFSEDLRPLIYDRFASFVIQQLVEICCKKAIEDVEKNKIFKDFSIKVSKFLLNNLECYVWDNIGNPVIRSCLCSLMQVSYKTNKIKPKTYGESKEEQTESKTLPEFIEIIQEFAERLILWPQFSEMCFADLTSGLFQTLLKILHKADKKLLKKYLNKLLEEVFIKENSEGVLPQAFLSTSVLMLLETSIQVVGKKLFSLYCEKLFQTRMVRLTTIKSTNFAVQKLFAGCTDKEQFEKLFDELNEHFYEILEKGHPAVILSICQTCRRLSSKQGIFIQKMMKTLNCTDNKEMHFILSMARLKPYSEENVNNENLAKERLSLEGTLMLQSMLEFNKPIKIVNGILSMEQNDLLNLFLNSMGSHIVDSYVKSYFVGEKSREKLVRKMNGTYQQLASTKYGSRSFEAIFRVANLKFKQQIMEELLHRENSWSNSEFGRIISNKINLALFKRNKEDWKNSLNQTESTALEVFAEVLKN